VVFVPERPPFQRKLWSLGISGLPRNPISQVSVMTCWSGGSDERELGGLQGAFGSAQPSSMEVRARLPCENLA